MIAVPLSARRRVIGLLEAFSAEPHGFNDSDVKSLNLLGELILSAIRPEEEHHLAEMARKVLPDTPPRTSSPQTQAVIAPPLPTPPVAKPISVPNILVDEKFLPKPAPRAPLPQEPIAISAKVDVSPIASEGAATAVSRKLDPAPQTPTQEPDVAESDHIEPVGSTLELG